MSGAQLWLTFGLTVVGKRSRECIAVGLTELRCVQGMARCLRELREGRWPK